MIVRSNLVRTVLASFLAVVIIFSFAGLLQKEKSSSLSFGTPIAAKLTNRTPCDLLTFPSIIESIPAPSVPLSFTINVSDRPASLFDNSTRMEIYDFIVANPGVAFRNICSELGIAIGTAEFHLGILKKAGLISFVRDGRYKRFFEVKRFSDKEMEMISLARHTTARSILEALLNRKAVSHGDLAFQLSITSQGLTWQMNRLKALGVVRERREGMRVIYSIEEAHTSVLAETMRILGQF